MPSPSLARLLVLLLAVPASGQVRALDLEWLRNAGARFDGTAVDHDVGSSVAAVGDLNDDGVADWATGALQSTNPIGIGDPPGTVYVYFGAAGQTFGGPVTGADVALVGEDDGWQTGTSVAGVGDVNGDGIADLLIGAGNAKANNITASGRAYVVWGGPQLTGTLDLATLMASGGGVILNGAQQSDKFGEAVGAAGDVNTDGMPDLIVGARGEGQAELATARGAAYVVQGGGLPAVVEIEAPVGATVTKLTGVANSDNAGDVVAGAGDVDSDGCPDVLIGAETAPTGAATHGAAWLVWGDAITGAPLSLGALGAAGVAMSGTVNGDRFGHDLAGAGDVDGDGEVDFLVGANEASLIAGGNKEGRAFLVYGTDALPPLFTASQVGVSVPGVSIVGTLGTAGASPGDRVGSSIAAGGDANGDGHPDLLLGANNADPNGDPQAGSVYLVYGGPGLPASFPLASLGARGVRLDGVATNDAVGGPFNGSIAFAGDVDDDGFDDLLLAGSVAKPAGTNSGSVWLVKGTCHMSQATGPVAEGGTLNLKAHGAAGVANLTFASLAALPVPINTKFGPWWMISQFDLLNWSFDSQGAMFLPLGMPPVGSGLAGLTIHMQTLGAPQGSKLDLTYLLSFTIE